MSSPALAERPIDGASFNWVRLDEPASTVYDSIVEMKTATVLLAGDRARRYAEAKEERIGRAATPLTID